MPFGAFRSTTLGGSVGAGNGGGGITELTLEWFKTEFIANFGQYLEMNSTSLLVGTSSSGLFKVYTLADGTNTANFDPAQPIKYTASTENYIFCGFEGGVYVYNWAGTLLNTITSPASASTVFGSMISTNDYMLFVADEDFNNSAPLSDGRIFGYLLSSIETVLPDDYWFDNYPTIDTGGLPWPQYLFSTNKAFFGSAPYSQTTGVINYFDASPSQMDGNSGYTIKTALPDESDGADHRTFGTTFTSDGDILYTPYNYSRGPSHPDGAINTMALQSQDYSTFGQSFILASDLPGLESRDLYSDYWGRPVNTSSGYSTPMATANGYLYVGAVLANVGGISANGYVTILKPTGLGTYDVHTPIFREATASNGAQFGYTIRANENYLAISGPADREVFVYRSLGSSV